MALSIKLEKKLVTLGALYSEYSGQTIEFISSQSSFVGDAHWTFTFVLLTLARLNFALSTIARLLSVTIYL